MLLLAEPFIPGDMVTFQRNGVRWGSVSGYHHLGVLLEMTAGAVA